MSNETAQPSPAGTTSPHGPARPSLTTVEEMKGYLSLGEWDTVTDEDYQRALHHGRRTNTFVRTHLNLTAEDLELHLSDPKHPMRIEGWIDAPSLWGYAEIRSGRFGMFVPVDFFHYGMRLLHGGVDERDLAQAFRLALENDTV